MIDHSRCDEGGAWCDDHACYAPPNHRALGAADRKRFDAAYPGVEPNVRDAIEQWHCNHGAGEPPHEYCIGFLGEVSP